jgi:hypothetical protein
MAGPTETITTTSNIPKFVEPYVTRLLGQAESFADPSKNPYQFYQGQRFSDINPLQRQAMSGASNLLPSDQLGQGSDIARRASEGAMQGGIFDLAAADQYMSPYMQRVLDVQKQNAMRDYQRQMPMLQAQGAKFGAIGGSRAAIAKSEAQRNLQNSLQGIDATGLQNAFQQAQQQYNEDQRRRMQGYSTAMQGASTLGALGQNEFSQRMDAINAQRQAGSDLYGYDQQQRDFEFQEFTNAQNAPYRNMEFLSNMYRGLPTDTTKSVYGASPDMLTSGVGLLGAAGGFKRGGLTGGLGGLYMRDR